MFERFENFHKTARRVDSKLIHKEDVSIHQLLTYTSRLSFPLALYTAVSVIVGDR